MRLFSSSFSLALRTFNSRNWIVWARGDCNNRVCDWLRYSCPLSLHTHLLLHSHSLSLHTWKQGLIRCPLFPSIALFLLPFCSRSMVSLLPFISRSQASITSYSLRLQPSHHHSYLLSLLVLPPPHTFLNFWAVPSSPFHSSSLSSFHPSLPPSLFMNTWDVSCILVFHVVDQCSAPHLDKL